MRRRIRDFLSIWWNEHHDKSNNFFSGLSSIITILAIVIGGAWTAYTFEALHQADKAKEELTEIQERIKNTASSSIDLKITQTENPKLGLVIEVALANNGRTKLQYSLKNNPLMVYQVKMRGSQMGAEKIYQPKPYRTLELMGSKNKNQTRESITVLTGSKKTVSYALTVEKPGLYYVTFEADHDGSVKIDEIDENIKWFASKFFEVK